MTIGKVVTCADRSLSLAQFLDDHRHEPTPEGKARLLSGEPPTSGDPAFDTRLAAMAATPAASAFTCEMASS